MMLLDLTLSLAADNPIFATIPANKKPLLASGHLGTHMDTLLQRPVPLDWMDRRATVVDVGALGWEIGPDCLDGIDIADGDAVLFRTGHLAAHPYGGADYFRDHPQLAWPVVEILVARGASFIGIDAPALRRDSGDHARVDKFCEERGTYVIENVANLDVLAAIAPSRFPLRVAWIAHAGLTGMPVKLVAVLPEQVIS